MAPHEELRAIDWTAGLAPDLHAPRQRRGTRAPRRLWYGAAERAAPAYGRWRRIAPRRGGGTGRPRALGAVGSLAPGARPARRRTRRLATSSRPGCGPRTGAHTPRLAVARERAQRRSA